MTEEPELQTIAQGREAEIFACEDGTVLRLLRDSDDPQQVEWEAGVPAPAVHGVTAAEHSDPMFVAAAPQAIAGRPGWLATESAPSPGSRSPMAS